MIIDKIINLSNYKHLEKVDQFLKRHTNILDNGKYIVDENCYLVVSEYKPKEDEGVFEGHQKYIDIQMLMVGEECVQVQTKNDCELVQEYDEQQDVAFYRAVHYMNCYLDGSNFILLTPNDLHNPSLCVGGNKVKVKKYVFKILAQ